MGEYVEKVKAKARLTALVKQYGESKRVHDWAVCAGINMAISELDQIPLTNITPTPDAELTAVWELFGNDDDTGASYFCSRCQWNIDEDEFYDHNTFNPYKFCPNCGTKMITGVMH